TWQKLIAHTACSVAILTLTTSAAVAQVSGGADVAVRQTASTTCSSGEPVALTGNLHLQVSSTADPSGGNRYDIKMSSSYSGTGQMSQASYQGSGSYGYGFTSPDSPAQLTLQLS